MGDRQLTYPDAPDGVIRHWNKRRGALSFGDGESLPPLDCDLADLARRRLPATAPALPDDASGNTRKRHELLADLAGCSELALLNGLLTSHLRKRRYPKEVPVLFYRIWFEQGATLMQELSPRWLISSLISFAEAGQTEEERSLAREMGMLFSLMKLYEFERLHSGLPPDRPFPLRQKAKAELPMGMPPFSLVSGGLDINLLAPLWDRAQRLDVLGPLACHLLDRLNADPGTLFRRIAAMRETKRARIKARQSRED